MSALIDIIHIMKHIDALTKKAATGSPMSLCKKLSISKSTLYRIIQLMKALDCPIEYSRSRGTFFYYEEGQFVLPHWAKLPKVEEPKITINKNHAASIK